ncbi:unnamed protein product [Rotaria magnacalcarata]|uniref:Calcipressin-like protein n=2 Tax=Rotaria magnacalcarata TaxID=392030 RepID=A0A819PTV2_9BILA|nr:unnamed protein product [Rotaria magnacalcarata]CAF2097995.1 unnamed protein product [Rotaria magnacalcarata]CAF2240348.1 unnamed protein product [Rotaria magnacalcarata]CAF3976545.1 unnamed protein product [Rotaria magnacalcarata]CAF4017714.1 unnamed protein product [Rotaria magnacalcarata]
MIETTTNDFSIGNPTVTIETDTMSNSFLPNNIHAHDSQIEIDNYCINYIDDSLVETQSETIEKNKKLQSICKIEDNSCRLEVSQLPEEIFMDENIRCEFECIFHEFDSHVIISYANIFQRAYLNFSDSRLAFQVRTCMNGKEFHNKRIQMSYSLQISSSIDYLKPPKQENIYMQSPPTTPPVGWVTKYEELPDINFDLFLALSKLQSNEPLEILSKQNNFPAIIIHPCSDTSDDDVDRDDIVNPTIDEFRNEKKYQTAEAKQCARILHDAMFALDEQQIKQTTGDGDKLVALDDIDRSF